MKNMGRKLVAAVCGAAFLAANMMPVMAANQEGEKVMAKKIVQTAGRDALGEFAPDFARYNDDILFGEVWSRNDILSLHDRSLITISALVAGGIIDSTISRPQKPMA